MKEAVGFVFGSSGDILALMFVIWAIASSEIIVMVTMYRYMSKNGISMDVSKLRKLRDQ